MWAQGDRGVIKGVSLDQVMINGLSLFRVLPLHHTHGDLTSLAPHERLPEILVVLLNMACLNSSFFLD